MPVDEEKPPPDKEDKRVERFKEIERFKLSVWIAKAFSTFVLFTIGTVMITYLYLSVTTGKLPDLNSVGSTLSGFFEVIKVIVSP